jgi:hypothetical protein
MSFNVVHLALETWTWNRFGPLARPTDEIEKRVHHGIIHFPLRPSFGPRVVDFMERNEKPHRLHILDPYTLRDVDRRVRPFISTIIEKRTNESGPKDFLATGQIGNECRRQSYDRNAEDTHPPRQADMVVTVILKSFFDSVVSVVFTPMFAVKPLAEPGPMHEGSMNEPLNEPAADNDVYEGKSNASEKKKI